MLKPDVDRGLRELIRTAVGMPEHSVRPMHQAAPTKAHAHTHCGEQESDQFATVQVTVFQTTGWDDKVLKNEATPSLNVTDIAQGQRLLSVSVQFYRADAYQQALRLGARLQLDRQIEKMQALGIGLVRVGAAKDLTALVDTNWETRAQIDLEFYLIAREADSLPTIGSVRVSTYGKESSNQPTNQGEVIAP